MSARATYLTQSGIRLLEDWGANLRRMFPGHGGPYLVGSALTTADYRDVDVRLIVDDDVASRLGELLGLADLNMCVSLWGQQVTRLPIDFQVQGVTEANAEPHGRRHPLGLRALTGPADTAGDPPAWPAPRT